MCLIKASVMMHRKGLSLAVKLNVVRCMEVAKHQFSVCKALLCSRVDSTNYFEN
jgi:hypothetical protein